MTDKRMTYEQWTAAFKHNLKKKAIHTLTTCFQWTIFSLLFAGVPLGMICLLYTSDAADE